MAHNLNFNKGQYSFFTVKEKAWHGLGKVVQNAPTAAEAIKLAALDYTVELQEVKTNQGIIIPNCFAPVRTDTNVPFGVVGSLYNVLQNREAFTFFDSIVGEGAAIYETAGALGEGETVFITAKLPESIRVGRDDLIDQYLFLTNNHSGEEQVTAAFTPVRIVCNNTLNAALKNCSMKVKIRHNARMQDKLKEAHKLMGIVANASKKFEKVFNIMARTPIVDQQLKHLIFETFAKPEHYNKLGLNEKVDRFERLISDVYAYAQLSDTQQTETTRGTVFGAYNAVTGYLNNVRKPRKNGSRDPQEGVLRSILDGRSFEYAQKALNLCLDLI
jgi:phage/plasmid-like protein (TIGR03299 family)